MSHIVRMVIAHPNRLFRDCLVSVLSEAPGLHVTQIDHEGAHYLGAAVAESPDVLLVGLGLPGGRAVELIRHVRAHLGGARIVLLARSDRDECLYECFAAGVHGCVLEDAPLDELKQAVEAVARGEAFCPPRLVYEMFRRLTAVAHASRWPRRMEGVELTPRELEIVDLVAQRLSNKEIARRLSLSLYTVKNHVHNIVEKLHVEDRHAAVEAVRKGRRQGAALAAAAEPVGGT